MTRARRLRAILSALAALSVAGTVAGRAQTPANDGVFGSRSHFTETSGAAIYRSVCAGCHMADAHGATGAATYPSLADNPRLVAPAYPIGVVLHGQGAMPPFARLLSDQQIADVVGYLRQSFGNTYPDAVTATDVAAMR